MDSLHTLNGTTSLAQLAAGTLTCSQVVRSTLARIEERNPQVLAWACLRPDLVLARAEELDALPRAERGPLHGLLVGVKDIISTKDLPTEHGSPLYKDSQVGVDAAVVALLRQAGAIVFGKTTTTEFAAYKRATKTRNPADLSRTPGGSSSGSAAAVADFQCHVALGTQTAGSTIRPASFTGVYSFKPTFGSVCHEGIKSFSPSNDTIGFFARSIADLQLLTRAVHLVDDDFVPSPRTRPLRIAMCKTTMWSLAEQPTIDALAAAEALLVASGAEVTHLTLPAPFSHLVPLQTIIMSSEARASNLVAHLLATSLPAAPDGSAWMHEDLSKLVLNRIPRTQLLAALDHIATLRPLLDSLILQGSYDALLCPSAPGVAPKVEDGTGDPRFCTGWTILHVPVVNVPFPVGAGKLPVGLSLVGSRYGDTKLLEIAQRVDQIFRPTA